MLQYLTQHSIKHYQKKDLFIQYLMSIMKNMELENMDSMEQVIDMFQKELQN